MDSVSVSHVKTKAYKVVTYADHWQDDYVKYFADYQSAYKHYLCTLSGYRHARWTAGSAIIHVETDTTINKKEWKV